MKFLRNTIYLVLTLIPLVFLIYFLFTYMVDVPYWDQWDLVPLIEKSYQGSLSFNDLWTQHNEHRIFFPKIIMIMLARFSNWKISYELMTNILLGVGIFLVITYQFKKTDKSVNDHKAYWVIPVISLITFSLSQFQNWLWGWQIQMLLSVLAVVVGIVFLANYATKWLCYTIAIIMGIIATYSFSNGLIYWFVGLLILFFVNHQDKRNKILKIIIWTAVSLIIIGTYMYKYHKPEDSPPLLLFVRYPIEYMKYILAYLGAPLCFYSIEGAIFFGLFGLIVSAFIVWKLIRVRYIKFHILVPYIALSFYSIGSAMFTGIGRVGFGAGQALHSRYVTVSNLFWISNIVFFYLFANIKHIELKNKIVQIRSVKSQADELCQLCSDGASSQGRRLSVITIITIFVIFVILNSLHSTASFKNYYNWLMPARDALRSTELQSAKNEGLLNRLYPRVEVVKTGRAILKKYKLSVFRDSER